MFRPQLITAPDFQRAWIEALQLIGANGWVLDGLIVHIENAISFDEAIHQQVRDFLGEGGDPKHTAYTIFPHGLYRRTRSAEAVFREYNRPEGLYERLRRRSRGRWGTYFRRMTHYETDGGVVNQLDNIITALNERERVYRTAYSVVIQKPGGETTRPRGGPCLTNVSLRLRTGEYTTLDLVCMYRNHDFLQKAYGNYWGLCNLLSFLARETDVRAGTLTCVSSRAYVDDGRTGLVPFIDELARRG